MTETAPAAAGTTPPPATGISDFLRLAGGVAGAFARSPRGFELREALHAWLRETAARKGSDDLVVNLGVKKVLVVGGRPLSRHVLEGRPREDAYIEGAIKAKSMAVLAPRALTVAHGERWVRLRAFTEAVLGTVADPAHRRAYLDEVRRAFDRPVRSVEEVRACMREANRGIVFGHGAAPESLSRDVEFLFSLVQSPVKRMALGLPARRRRRRLYDALRRLWDDPAAAGRRTLLGAARRHAPAGADPGEVLEQVPHWMFTFTGSGTDLLARSLALVGSTPDAWERARREAPGAAERAAAGEGGGYLEACLRESARLYPPVTRTFHRAPRGDAFGGVSIPPGMEIVHSLPLVQSERASPPAARSFRPERWVVPAEAEEAEAFVNPFLGGARSCPGEALVFLVCTTALAHLLERGVRAASDELSREPLPFSFPRALRFTGA